jgi:hypothetical protein
MDLVDLQRIPEYNSGLLPCVPETQFYLIFSEFTAQERLEYNKVVFSGYMVRQKEVTTNGGIN